MDITMLQLVIAGGSVSLAISLFRRFFPMNSDLTGYVAVGVCMLVVLLFRFIESNQQALEFVKQFLVIYGTGQALYNTILKPTELDKAIEGK